MNTTEKLKKIIEYIAKYLDDKINSYSLILKNVPEDDLCSRIYLTICVFIIYFVCIFIIFQSIVISLDFLYNKITLQLRDNPQLSYNPNISQINNYIFLTRWLCIETNMLTSFILIVIFFIALLYLYSKVLNINLLKEWSYLIMFISMSFILIIFYFILFYKKINLIANLNHNMLNLIYKNINKEYLKDNVCNYFNNSESDIKFEYGKCNDFKDSDENKLNNYINTQIYKIGKYVDITDKTADKQYFKNIKDENDISYYDKIYTAIITHSIVKFYKSLNDNDGKEFFSIYNIYNNNFIEELFKYKINPFLNITYTNLDILPFKFVTGFSEIDESLLISYIKNDYMKFKNNLTNSIINFLNISKSITPVAYSYFMIVLSFILLFFIRLIQHVTF